MSNYKPNAKPEQTSDEMTLSGRTARENVRIEEHNQSRVAESEVWMLAKKQQSVGDSKSGLEALGFTNVAEADDLFYRVDPPTGWTKSTEGFWTYVKDDKGNDRIMMFYKGAWYDRRAFLSITQINSAENE